ncbi:translocator protein homolog [Vicia villosa]|uniref:translocator protein homolog n=1 Tax=Vicia villosa TaxID=3911 RepID=UPI00273B02D3|nr:translocator protein homolog [Vicia villosa]
MASSTTDLKQRFVTPTPDQTTTTTNEDNKNGTVNLKRDKRMAMAKRGLRSLIIALSVPLSITLLSIYIASSFTFSNHNTQSIASSRKPFWFPPSWLLHLMLPSSSLLMGLSAWLVWAEGGFHRDPTAFLLYLIQLLCTVLWEPVVFGVGATSFGLLLCVGIFGSLIGCMYVFGKVNPVASDLIKPCLAVSAFLFIVNLKLIYM